MTSPYLTTRRVTAKALPRGRAAPWRPPYPAPARCTRIHSGAQAGSLAEPRRPAPSGRQAPRFPVRQPRRLPPGTSNDPLPDSPMVSRFRDKIAPDSPRVIPETGCKSSSWKWWPGTESNHRHADFQYSGEPGSVRESRRKGTRFRRVDRTALPDRADSEPLGPVPTKPRRKAKKRKGAGASRPSGVRTGRQATAVLGTWETKTLRSWRPAAGSTCEPG